MPNNPNADDLVEDLLAGPSRLQTPEQHRRRAGLERVLRGIITPTTIAKATAEAEVLRLAERKALLAQLSAVDQQNEKAGNAFRTKNDAAADRVASLEAELDRARVELMMIRGEWSSASNVAERRRGEIHRRLIETASPEVEELIATVERHLRDIRARGVAVSFERTWTGATRHVSDWSRVMWQMNELTALAAAARALRVTSADESKELAALRGRLQNILELRGAPAMDAPAKEEPA